MGVQSRGKQGGRPRANVTAPAGVEGDAGWTRSLVRAIAFGLPVAITSALFVYRLSQDPTPSDDLTPPASLGNATAPRDLDFEFEALPKTLPWGGAVQHGALPKPCLVSSSDAPGAERQFQVVREAATSVALELRSTMDSLRSDAFGTHKDEVDDQPAYEMYLLNQGEVPEGSEKFLGQEVSSRLSSLLQLALGKVMPYVRSRYNCSNCTACTAFARRYSPNERRLNPSHFDMEAYVTMVFALSNSSEYKGGMYVSSTPDAASRRFLPMDMGDVFVHQYDVNHGVAVTGGKRQSIVVWVSSDETACREGRSPWYAVDAARGDADAQWNLGHLYKRGERGVATDLEQAAVWYGRSAMQGHSGAMNNLALLLEKDIGSPEHRAEGARFWWRKSAELGEGNGQFNYALHLSEQGEHVEARSWLSKAASQGAPRAMTTLGKWLELGEGGPKDITSAARWYQKAADAGFAKGFCMLGSVHAAAAKWGDAVRSRMQGALAGEVDCMVAIADQYLNGQGVPASKEKTEWWLKRAAAAGKVEL